MKDILIRKTRYTDGSIAWMMAIKHDGKMTEIKLKKYQYEQMKSTGLFIFSETDFKPQK